MTPIMKKNNLSWIFLNMAEDLSNPLIKTEDIVDKYVKCQTSELRQTLINKLIAFRDKI